MKVCLVCGEQLPSKRHTYCPPCAKKVQRDAARDKGKRRLKGCLKCGGENRGQGSRFCEPCRESLLPLWQQADLERGRRRRERDKGKRAQLIEPNLLDDKARTITVDFGTKRCARCKEFKTYSAFGRQSKNKDGMANYCLICANEYGHERRMITVFGITRERYDAMLEAQDNRCAICRNKPGKRRLAVDHNHKTGAIRGLLCTRCNQKLLGSANENPELLRRAADYLESFIVKAAS